jgi:DNA polymerase-3 subunit alpha
VYSCYSPQDGAQSTDQIAKRAAKLGMESVALTDHGRCGGLLALKKSCTAAGVRPIYGLEAYIAPKSRLIKEKLDDHPKTSYHLTLLAKNMEGLRNLFRITSASWRDGMYYKPRADMELLKKHSKGIIALSGCGSGRISVYAMNNMADRIRPHINKMLDIYGDDFYIEVQNHGFEWQKPLKNILFDISNTLSIPIVATQDSHYQTREDADLHRAICKLAAGDLSFEGDESYFKSCEDMCEMFEPDEQHAIFRTQTVADKCRCDWEYGKTIWPVYKLPDKKTPEGLLRELAHEGLIKRFGEPTPEYRDRLDFELGVIERMGFPTYFLVVSDFINWAKAAGIPVSAGRGSSAGSLVCYCIGITNVDPIPYGLYFERFLNPSRVSLPDIDTDLCKQRRGEVINYVIDKYGSSKVAQIGTYGEFKPRGSLRSFSRVLGYSADVGHELASLVPPDIAGKALKFHEFIDKEPKLLNSKYQDVISLAKAAEGLICQAGIHAAGVVISDIDIDSYVPLFCGKHNEVATQFDMHDVEDIGLVKCDFLGLKNLTVIQDTINLVKKYKNIDIDISSIEYNDQKVYADTFQRGKLDGIFQFETSSGFKDLCVRVKPKSIEDLAAITALYRPGPLDTGLVDKYAERRAGAPAEFLIPELETILNETFGVMVYQEQIMKICTDVAGYTLAEADNMRRIIGKKQPEKMKLEHDKFIGGCTSNNISEKAATQLFNDIEGFAKYSFNKTLDKDTLVDTINGAKKIEDCIPGDIVFSISKDGNVEQSEVIALHDHGIVPIWEVEFDDGTIEKCTLDHKWLTSSGQIPLATIIQKDESVWGSIRNTNMEWNNIERKILRTNFVGFRQGYDLEVSHPEHNYLLKSGLCCSNSHAVAYSITSYQTAWLKTYYPIEFFCALLSNSIGDQKDLVKYFRAAQEWNIPVQLPDVNLSDSLFTINNGIIIFGLSGIKGLGEKECETFLRLRPEDGFTSIEHMITCGINRRVITALATSGALSEILDIPVNMLLHNIESMMTYYDKLARWEVREANIKIREEEILKAITDGVKPPRKLPKNKERPEKPVLEKIPEMSRRERLALEHDTLGVYLTGHPMDEYPNLCRNAQCNIQDMMDGNVPNETFVRIPVVVSNITKRTTRAGNSMAILTLEDQYGSVEAVVFQKAWDKVKDWIEEDQVVIISGYVKVIMSEENDTPATIRIVVRNIADVDDQTGKIEPLKVMLKDSSVVTFIPPQNQNYSQYIQAVAVIKNWNI